MSKCGHPEADLQRQIVQTLRLVLPRTAIVHASNNEVRGGDAWARKQQALMVSMGQYPGFADLLVMDGGRVLFLEVKTAKGALSDAQCDFADRVMDQGHGFEVVRSVDQALAALRKHGFRTKIVGAN
jgi:hypothetical protein